MALPAPLVPLTQDAAHTAVLLDFDGTLSHIVPRSDDAVLVDGARTILAGLRDRVGLLAFISGRALADVRERVGVHGCAYAGNHGMELCVPGGEPRVVGPVRDWVPAIHAFGRHLDTAVMDAAGLVVEDKGPSLSIHWRTAPDRDVAGEAARRWLAPLARASGFHTSWGRMVLEVRPAVRVDKGTAVAELIAGTGLRHALSAGDDHTDADGWRRLRALHADGTLHTVVTVMSDSPEADPSLRDAVDVRVDGPDGVLALLGAYLTAIT